MSYLVAAVAAVATVGWRSSRKYAFPNDRAFLPLRLLRLGAATNKKCREGGVAWRVVCTVA